MKFFAVVLLAVAVAHAQVSSESSLEDSTYETVAPNGDQCICIAPKVVDVVESKAAIPQECVQYVDTDSVVDYAKGAAAKKGAAAAKKHAAKKGAAKKGAAARKQYWGKKGAAKKGAAQKSVYRHHY